MALLITQTPDLRAFFAQELRTVCDKRRIKATPAAERYLAELLATGRLSDGPLALMFAEASTASSGEKALILKQIGDTALFIGGFFADHGESAGLGASYYASLGGRAYETLAGMTRTAVYSELAAKFRRFLEVLTELYELTALNTPEGQLKMYERYLRTGDDGLRCRLNISRPGAA